MYRPLKVCLNFQTFALSLRILQELFHCHSDFCLSAILTFVQRFVEFEQANNLWVARKYQL